MNGAGSGFWGGLKLLDGFHKVHPPQGRSRAKGFGWPMQGAGEYVNEGATGSLFSLRSKEERRA